MNHAVITAAALEQQKQELLTRVTEQSALLVELTQQSRLMKDDVDASGGRWAQEMELLRDALDAKTAETEVLRNALDSAVGDARAQSAAPAPALALVPAAPAAPSVRASLGVAPQQQQSADVAALSRLETTAAVARAVERACADGAAETVAAVERARADAAAEAVAAVERARADAAGATAAAVECAVERARNDAREAQSGLHAIASGELIVCEPLHFLRILLTV